uniref:Uncharacterized protein n=1 Tax=Neobodo designis TaxID=312471 RepID=A0A7S1LXH5_NEODS
MPRDRVQRSADTGAVHSRGALQAINRALIRRYCYEGDRVEIEDHLLRQSRIAHDQTVGVRRVAELLQATESVLEGSSWETVVPTPGDALDRTAPLPEVRSTVQPYEDNAERDDDAFEVHFQRRKLPLGLRTAAPPPRTPLVRRRSLNGASFEFGAVSEATADRKRRWLPCFAAFEAIEKSLSALEETSTDAEDDPNAPRPISSRDKEEALVEGFESEAADMAAFLRQWAEVLHGRINVACVKLNVSRHTKMISRPCRAVQVGEPSAAIAHRQLNENVDDMSVPTSPASSTDSFEDPFGASAPTKRVRSPFQWMTSCGNAGFLMVAERAACATRIQAFFRGFVCRRVVGNVASGRRTFYQARNMGIAKAWLSRKDLYASPRRIATDPVAQTGTQLLVGFVGSNDGEFPKPRFSAFAIEHFAESFDDETERWSQLGGFLQQVNAAQHADPFATLLFTLLSGDLSPDQERRFVDVLVGFVRSRHPHATTSMLPLDVSPAEETMSPSAIRNFLRACTSLPGCHLSLGACHRRFWSTAERMVPSWVPATDFSTLHPLDRKTRHRLQEEPDPSAPERKVSLRQALLFATLAFCLYE